MIPFTDFSFLAPAGITPTPVPLDAGTAEHLQLSMLFTHDPTPYFTADPRVIAYRQELFRDTENIPAVAGILDTLCEQIDILADLCRGEEEDTADNEVCVRDLVLLTVYTRLIKNAHAALADLPLRADCLLRLRDLLESIAKDREFGLLCENLDRVSVDIEQVKSVIVGINLDAQLRPREAGVIAIQSEYYKSGEWIDRLLRLEWTKKDFTCIAPLAPLSKKLTAQEQAHLQNALNGALDKIMGHSLRRARGNSLRTLRAWCRDLLPLLPELTFVTDARRLLATWREAGMPYCYPHLSREGKTVLDRLYNPHLLRAAQTGRIVANRFEADESRRIFLLTGSNSGGKTVYTVAVALCYLLTGLGMPIPAAQGEITPAANILVHFPDRNANQYRGGRLEEECRHLAELKQALSPGTLFFMDETFSSTGAEEATALAEKYLDTLLHAGCLCLFATHLHDLARACVDRAGYVTLSAQPGSYRIVPGHPIGSSYAEQIARSYGLT